MIYMNEFMLFIFLLFSGAVLSLVYTSRVFNSSLKTLFEIGRTNLKGFSSVSIIEVIKDTMTDIAQCDALAIYTLNQQEDGYDTYTNYNLTEDFHIRLIKQNNGFLSNIINRGRVNVLTSFPVVLKDYGFETCICVPLIFKDESVGLALLLSRHKREYEQREIQYIEGISRQLVRVMNNIQNLEGDISIESIFKFIKTIELNDPYNVSHSLQVAELAFELGRHFDLSEEELRLIKFAGLLHDVGKVAIPEQILNKPGALDDYEWKIMKKHPEKSAAIIREIEYFKDALSCILHHHEKWDGTGYPGGLKGKEIPFFSRILAVCDTYSAMVSDRPYRKARADKEARAEIEKFKGKQFDPEVVNIFLKLTDDFLRGVIDK